ncbi:MAG: response regulator [Spirochaetales bacterium]|nr:response regulator [Spirochaetales bacterium]
MNNGDSNQTDLTRLRSKLKEALGKMEVILHNNKGLEISHDLLEIEKDLQRASQLSDALGRNQRNRSSEANEKHRGSTTILVVDDEEMVLQVTCIIISKMGFRPLAFSSSLKALEYYRENYSSVSLVLLDMIMPEMNGKELFLAMKKIHPPIKAMLLSGWIDKEETANINDIGLLEFLHKPIEKSILEENILKALKG